MKSMVCLAALAVVGASCNVLWDAATRGSLREDIAEILAGADVPVTCSACHMHGTTRTGYCLFRDDRRQVETMAASLGMDGPYLVGMGQAPDVPPLPPDSPCLAQTPSSAPDEVLAYLIEGRPSVLRTDDGSQFEYMLITLDVSSSSACVEVSYSYG